MGKRALLSTCVFLCLAAPALADDSAAEPAIGFPGTLGLTGFQDMIDARVPALLSIRAGGRYDALVRDREFRGTINVIKHEQRHELTLWAGVSALGLADVSVRLPYVYERDENNAKGIANAVRTAYGNAVDLDLAGKISLGVGPIVVAPYAFGRMPIAEPDLEDAAQLEYGVAATLDLLNRYVGFHVNLAGLNVEKGLFGARYRAGVSFVLPFASETFLMRVYAYGDGVEFEGNADSDIDADFGAQALLFGILTVHLGFTVRVFDAGLITVDEKRTLREQLGVFDRHFDDEGNWGVHLDAGVILTF